ncbi:GNAT family N-acetyltransferase [Demequina rhizosphaerae]|uniref:GNAT family N-acetyltransferase n=1 Tax=Demequina rhizosphaerae TaxID=1638985 RepID=UPI000784C9FF|nr:GNAT family N-acetyltransferase [Demequina rhizosphaerae]
MTGRVEYRSDVRPTAAQYIDAARRSTLGERLPIDEPDLIQEALDRSDIVVTAWDGERLVGFLRAITDFRLICYLQELGVDADRQREGIGLALQVEMRALLGPRCKIRVSEAPGAAGYYARHGYARHHRSWELLPGDPLV